MHEDHFHVLYSIVCQCTTPNRNNSEHTFDLKLAFKFGSEETFGVSSLEFCNDIFCISRFDILKVPLGSILPLLKLILFDNLSKFKTNEREQDNQTTGHVRHFVKRKTLF